MPCGHGGRLIWIGRRRGRRKKKKIE